MARYIMPPNKTIKIVTGPEMQQIDRRTIDYMGVPGIVLMENAGVGCVQEIEKFVLQKNIKQKSALIFCGRGNNGGDGFVIARHLYNRGWNIKALLLGKEDNLSGDALANFQIARNMGVEIEELVDRDFTGQGPEGTGLIVDAIFGTGLKGEIQGTALPIIKAINRTNISVVSVDMPSGLPTDRIIPVGECLKADLTCTLGLPKISQLLGRTQRFVGQLVILDIGFPRQYLEHADIKTNLIACEDLNQVKIPFDKIKLHEMIIRDDLDIQDCHDPVAAIRKLAQNNQKITMLKTTRPMIADPATDNVYILGRPSHLIVS